MQKLNTQQPYFLSHRESEANIDIDSYVYVFMPWL